MRKIIISIAVMCLFTTLSFAQQVISNKGDKLNLSDLQKEPWQVVGTTNKATLNNQNIYQMGNVGIGTNAPTAGLDVNGTMFVSILADGNVANEYPRKVVVLADGTLGYADRQYNNSTTLVGAGTGFLPFNTLATGVATAANGNLTSVKGGLLYIMGDAQLSTLDNSGTRIAGFSFWIDGVKVDEVLKYFPNASKNPYILNFIIPAIAVGNHTWELKFNGGTTIADYSQVDNSHKYQLKMVEIGS